MRSHKKNEKPQTQMLMERQKKRNDNVEIYQIFSHRNSMLVSLPLLVYFTLPYERLIINGTSKGLENEIIRICYICLA